MTMEMYMERSVDFNSEVSKINVNHLVYLLKVNKYKGQLLLCCCEGKCCLLFKWVIMMTVRHIVNCSIWGTERPLLTF